MTTPTPTRPDLVCETDVERFVRGFYRDVAQDDLLGPMFNDIAAVDWDAHIPKLTAFWCRYLFKHKGYEGDPHEMHLAVHQQSPFRAEMFWRWLDLFHQHLDTDWHGTNVERMKTLARAVARVHCRNLTGDEIDFGDPPGHIAVQA